MNCPMSDSMTGEFAYIPNHTLSSDNAIAINSLLGYHIRLCEECVLERDDGASFLCFRSSVVV